MSDLPELPAPAHGFYAAPMYNADQMQSYALAARAPLEAEIARLTEELGALADVIAERRRQVEAEGWTPEHDDEHTAGELAYAAVSYAIEAAYLTDGMKWDVTRDPPVWWPWDRGAWKLANPRRMLVKSAALILAEIERLDRRGETGAAMSELKPCPFCGGEASADGRLSITQMDRPRKTLTRLRARPAAALPEPQGIRYKPETWPEDADGDKPRLCTVCGTPVHYGERHHGCGAAVMKAEAAAVSAAPLATFVESSTRLR